MVVRHRNKLLQHVHGRERRLRVAQDRILEGLEVRVVRECLGLRRKSLENAEAPVAPSRVVRNVDPTRLHPRKRNRNILDPTALGTAKLCFEV